MGEYQLYEFLAKEVYEEDEDGEGEGDDEAW